MTEQKDENNPPIFRNWKIFYIVVFIWLVIQILLYSLFTLIYS